MATPSGREDSSSQAPCHGEQGSEACVEELDHPERLEAKVPDQSVMWKKAQEFFQTCDSEGKGFIARTDLQVRGSPLGAARGLPGRSSLSRKDLHIFALEGLSVRTV